MSNIGVLATHCCKQYGCKYGDKDIKILWEKTAGVKTTKTPEAVYDAG